MKHRGVEYAEEAHRSLAKPPQEDPGLVEYAEDETPITGEDKIAADPR